MDLKNKIRVALGLDAEVKLEVQEKLVDGTIIVSTADALDVGSDVSVLAEDGTTIKLAPGDYELENGTTFSVAEEGVIAEITAPEKEEAKEEEDEEYMEEELSLEEEETQEDDEKVAEEEAIDNPAPKKIKETKEYEFSKEDVISEITVVVSELLSEAQKDIESIRAELSEMRGYTETLEQQNEALNEDLTKLSKEPAAEDINTSKFTNNNVKELTKRELGKMTTKERLLYNLEKINNNK